MKILVISLLRMGDLAMQAQALRQLRAKYKDAEIHLLTNRSNSEVAELITDTHRVHYFDRDRIQVGLGSIDSSFFESFDRVLDLVKRLNREEFQLCINFTHNRLSAHLAGLIDAEEKQGLVIFPDGKSQLGNTWFRYLNDYSLAGGSNQVHMTDVFVNAIGDEAPSNEPLFKIPYEPKGKRTIAIQPWSSEVQKDWSDDLWIESIRLLNGYAPDHTVQVLFHSSNLKKFEALKRLAEVKGVLLEGLSRPILELLTELKSNCDLLISVDTGIKHLAAFSGVRTLELSLGNTDLHKTGVYQDGAFILRQSSETLQAFEVASIAYEILRKQIGNVRKLAIEYADRLNVFQVQIVEGLGFYAAPITEIEKFHSWSSLLRGFARRQVLNSPVEGPVQPAGTMAIQFRKAMLNLPEMPTASLREFFMSIESQTMARENRITEIERMLVKQLQQGSIAEELVTKISLLEKEMSLGHFLTQFVQEPISFYNIRRLLSILAELRGTEKLIWKIIRSFEKTKDLELT